MPVPIFVFQIRVSVKYHQATLALQIPHILGHTHVRWDRYKHVDMIWAAFRFQYLDPFSFTQFS